MRQSPVALLVLSVLFLLLVLSIFILPNSFSLTGRKGGNSSSSADLYAWVFNASLLDGEDDSDFYHPLPSSNEETLEGDGSTSKNGGDSDYYQVDNSKDHGTTMLSDFVNMVLEEEEKDVPKNNDDEDQKTKNSTRFGFFSWLLLNYFSPSSTTTFSQPLCTPWKMRISNNKKKQNEAAYQQQQSLIERCTRACGGGAAATESEESEVTNCSKLLSSCVPIMTQACDISHFSILKKLIQDVVSQFFSSSSRNEKKTAVKEKKTSRKQQEQQEDRCERWLRQRCISRDPVTGKKIDRTHMRHGLCVQWKYSSLSSSSSSSYSSHLSLLRRSIEPEIEMKQIEKLILSAINASIVLDPAAAALKQILALLGNSRNKKNFKNKVEDSNSDDKINPIIISTLLLVDLEHFPCEPLRVKDEKQTEKSDKKDEQDEEEDEEKEVVLAIGRSQQQKRSGRRRRRKSTVLLPPTQFLQNPSSTTRDQEWVMRSLADSIGKCGLNSWNHRAPVHGVFCGTMFRPLPPLAQLVQEELGDLRRPTSSSSSSSSSPPRRRHIHVRNNYSSFSSNNNNNNNNNNLLREEGRKKHDFLLAFGRGVPARQRTFGLGRAAFSSQPGVIKVPYDWCDVSFCSLSSTASSASSWNPASSGFSLPQVKLGVVLEDWWLRAESSKYHILFAAAGTAPIILKDFRDRAAEKKDNNDDDYYSSSSSFLVFSRTESIFDLLASEWSTHIPWTVSGFSSSSRTHPTRQEKFRVAKEISSAEYSFNELLSLSSASNRNTEYDQALHQVAINLRGIVSSLRYKSHLQSAYLSSILFIAALAENTL